MKLFPMRWHVRNTFLEFFDDEEQVLCSVSRSASAPARMIKAYKQNPKSSHSRNSLSHAQCIHEHVGGEKDCIGVEKLQTKAETISKVEPPKLGGGLRRVAVRPAGPAPFQGKATVAPLADAGSGLQCLHINQAPSCLEIDSSPTPLTHDPAEAAEELVSDLARGSRRKSNKNQRRRRARHMTVESTAPTLDESQDQEEVFANDRGVALMIRHIACSYSQQQVKLALDELGLTGKYNFVHVPMNSKRTANLGYCFVNFYAPEHAEDCRAKIEGRVFGPSCTKKKCEVSLAHVQGKSHFARLHVECRTEEPHVGQPPEKCT